MIPGPLLRRAGGAGGSPPVWVQTTIIVTSLVLGIGTLVWWVFW